MLRAHWLGINQTELAILDGNLNRVAVPFYAQKKSEAVAGFASR